LGTAELQQATMMLRVASSGFLGRQFVLPSARDGAATGDNIASTGDGGCYKEPPMVLQGPRQKSCKKLCDTTNRLSCCFATRFLVMSPMRSRLLQ
jgi:hypothetical protein